MRISSIALAAIFFVSACSNMTKHSVPNEKEFSVPNELANKFSVKEEASIPIDSPKVEEVKENIQKKKKKKQKEEALSSMPKSEKAESFPNRWGVPPFFRVGEHYLFDITYFGATAGQLEMDILPNKVIAGRDSFHLQGRARTASVFSLFYRLNDVAESFMDSAGLFSHKFSLKLDESLQQREVLELYDQKVKKVYFWSKLDHKKKGKSQEQFETPFQGFAQDSISAFFYVRTLPLEVGKVYLFPIILNGRLTNVQVTVVRKEILPTKLGDIPAIVLKPEAVIEGVLKPAGDSFVWLSDDSERRILKIDAKIKVGSVIGYLREHNYDGPPKAKN